MTTALNERRFTKRGVLAPAFASLVLFALGSLSLDAQDIPKVKDKDDKPAAKADDLAQRGSIETSGYTRPGNPDDKLSADGKMVDVSFTGANVQKFKIMGGTVYFAVFKNTGVAEGDTFATGMANLDTRFQSGRSYRDTVSPRFDRKAKYLYLYQVVNDRNLGAVAVKGGKTDGGISLPVYDPKKIDAKTKVPEADDIASFALKILVDPRDITSWGHFRDAGFVSSVVDTDLAGIAVKGEKEKILAVSHLPAIETKIANPRFHRRARSNSLGELENGFGVSKSNINMQASKAFGELKQVVGQLDKTNVKWVNFVNGLIEGADVGREPEYVQLMYGPSEERYAAPIIPGGVVDGLEDDVTRVIFRADWERTRAMKQGERSVVFGFTTDLPPVEAPIRIDTPRGAMASDGMRLANYFSEEVVARSTAAGAGVVFTAGGADAALALALGTAVGQAPTPTPAAAAPAAGGFAGITGGFGGLGGNTSGAGTGGLAIPGFAGGVGRQGGGMGGGGLMGGGGQDNGNGEGQRQADGQQGGQVLNFNQSLTNQQAQAQAQAQGQINGGGSCCCGTPPNGNVVPAPASVLLGLLGLPGLWFLRRRKGNEPDVETVAA